MASADAAEAIRARLQADLRTAMKQRRRHETATLRCLIAALDNAGAVQVPAAKRDYSQHEGRSEHVATGNGDGPTEVPRRRLSEDDVQRLLHNEHEERLAAAVEFERLGKPAEDLRAQAAIIAGYLRPPS